ncbi:MAG: CDP-diacylglycerol--glycerol-3-phosphate 3-phosphatidyltransferase [Deltaproteobacteria bacterium]|nr:CDP-diacylglycerol--glycerol-3-phosphate 3-phosphatidyltransferase [Deltaproteobacteria bacterium]
METELVPSRENVYTLPNLLTLIRIGSVPLLVVLLYLPGPTWSRAAAVVFFISGLTDLFDGILARRLRKVTLLGQFLDPVADKLLVGSMLVMLAALGRAPAWMAVLILGREIAVTGMRAVAASQGFQVPSDTMGKWKTAVQMLAVWLLMAYYPVGGVDVAFWGLLSLWAAVIITAWSGVGYFLRFRKRLGANYPQKP